MNFFLPNSAKIMTKGQVLTDESNAEESEKANYLEWRSLMSEIVSSVCKFTKQK